MRVAVLDLEGHVINLIAVENESDIAGFGFHAHRVLAEGEGVDIWENPTVVIERMELVINEHIQSVAKAKGYASIDSCSKYTQFDNTWKAECLGLLAWNVSVWETYHAISDGVALGNPAPGDLISLLPVAPL